MTNLESPKKNNDCYFYYYSSCSKGDSCPFRHEPSALGCETMCCFWKEGKCLNVHCNFRHMELRKNRKAIPCYWESRPGGCLKPHCPFLHQNPRPLTETESSITENCDEPKPSPVDSLVVKFEEDHETLPPANPEKACLTIKTLEEIKLAKVAAECAAFYSYQDEEDAATKEKSPQSGVNDLRYRILQRSRTKPGQKRGSTNGSENRVKRPRIESATEPKDIKIKTLEEIRSQKAMLQEQMEVVAPGVPEVSSTSNDEVFKAPPLIRKLNLKKIKSNKTETREEVGKPAAPEATPIIEENDSLLDESMLLSDDDAEDGVNVIINNEDCLLNEIDILLDN